MPDTTDVRADAHDGYSLIVLIGGSAPAGHTGKVVELDGIGGELDGEGRLTPLAAVQIVAASGLSVADLRSRTLVIVGGDSRRACTIYAALQGLAGRPLDVGDGSNIIPAARVQKAAASWGISARPRDPIILAQLGAAHPQLVSVGIEGSLTPEEVAVVSYSRRLRFVPASDPLTAVTQLIAIGTIRRRGLDDRLPQLVSGDEAIVGSVKEALVVGVDLDMIRRGGQELRRRGAPDSTVTVERAEPDARMLRLSKAAGVSMADTLLRLGARPNSDTGLWHCPRPQRHTNGDANASMKLSAGGTRCFRCDSERVDPLRLTMDTLGCSVDEAADWILSGQSVESLEAGAV